MASTIILKNGTGSAIPTNLAQGEPAINVDTGLIYYGSGSRGAVKSFSNFTNITASISSSLGGNISASGYVLGTNIIATGNVSASGNIVATGFISSSGRIQTLSHITASGNISASGFLSGSKIVSAADVSGTFINSRSPTTGYKLGGVKTLYKSGSGDIIVGQTNQKTIITGSSIVLGNNVVSHITASGNISSSGNVYSSNHEVLTAHTFKIIDLDNEKYGVPGNAGYSTPQWGFQLDNGANGLGNGNQHVGIVLPYKAILVGVIGQFRASATGNYQFALWTEKVDDGDGSSSTTWAETIITAAVNNTEATRTFNFEKLDGTTAFVKGTSIVPSFYNATGTDNSDCFGNYTIVIQRVI